MRLIEAETLPADDRPSLTGWVLLLMQSHVANFQEPGSAWQGNPSFSHLDQADAIIENESKSEDL